MTSWEKYGLVFFIYFLFKAFNGESVDVVYLVFAVIMAVVFMSAGKED
jgi:hypothetical protein